MHNFVSFNHRIFSASEAKLSAISSATFYGKNIFTTIAIYNSKPFLWEKHWLRLTENAQKIGIDLTDFSEASVKNSLAEIIKQNSILKGRMRLTFFDNKPNKIWSFDSKNRTDFLITTADLPENAEIKITVSPFRVNSTSPLVNTKSGNYLENLLALEAARKRGFDEALRLNEKGEIVSGCMANFFWLKNEKIFTPNLETGCLAGTTRGLILENFPVAEVKTDLADLTNADGIFLTSAGIGVVEVKTFERMIFEYSDNFRQITNFFDKFVIE